MFIYIIVFLVYKRVPAVTNKYGRSSSREHIAWWVYPGTRVYAKRLSKYGNNMLMALTLHNIPILSSPV